MKRIGMALGALVLLTAGFAPLAASAAKADLPPISKEDQAKGMKEAPAIVQTLKLSCDVTDARFIGNLTMNNKDGKPAGGPAYEVACKTGGGYTFLNKQPDPVVLDCLAAGESGALACRLPGNSDPKQVLAPYLADAGRTCTLKAAKYLGATPAGVTFYEAACTEGPGYVIQTAVRGSGGKALVQPCIALYDTKLACTLTTKDQSIAAAKTVFATSGKSCDVTDVRFIGQTQDGKDAWEVACAAKGVGFMTVSDGAGKVTQAVPCANASMMFGGCKLTDTTVAETEEAGVYTKLATDGGFPCTVSKYRYIGVTNGTPKREVVELVCSNRPDGTIAVLAADKGVKSDFYDCVRAGQLGQECKLNSPQSAYDSITKALVAKGRTTCKVAGARYIGATEAKNDVIEVACADGGPGFVLHMPQVGNTVAEVLSCGQSASAGAPCKLPTNVKK
ncbi:MAG: hypothetical protein AB1429_13335 [Pseudomonadota bacterium]|jgi:hypothetical protein